MAGSFWAWFKRRSPSKQDRSRLRAQPLVELLETRELLAATFTPDYVIFKPAGSAKPLDTAGPTGTTPTQISQAYGFNQINFNGVVGNGAGTTIAIVDAYDDPNIASDLQQFDAAFGLPNPTFTKVNQSGGSTLPAANAGWATEIALDVEWAHAIAPGAKILLVEANSSSETNLFAAVSYAAKQPGVVAVSMSWGGSEFSGETADDSTFTTPAGHIGVTFVNSSGDSGAPASYPSTSPNVLSVGGTTLNLSSTGAILSETGWSGSGGGISADEAQPSYQKGIVTQSTTKRTSPDVSYDADPNTGFPVYDSYNDGTVTPWAQYGGTSDASPQWAALIAIADQGRIQAGLPTLTGTQTLTDLYALPASDFHDITSGTSTGSPRESASAGYDLVTGRGTPVANLIVAGLVGTTSTTPAATHFSVTESSNSTTAGTAFTVTVTALDVNGNVVPSYTGTVQLSSSDSAAVLPASHTFTSANAGSFTFSVTLKTAGSQTVTATDTSNGTIVGSATETVTAAAASKLVFSTQPVAAVAGAVLGPITVEVLDTFGNLVTSDNSGSVTIGLGSNPGSSTLTGTTTVNINGGVATFSTLSINNAGNGYTLTATSGALIGATSNSFNITAASTGGGGGSGGSGGGSTTGTVIESFETSEMWNIASGYNATAVLATYAAHDGSYGLDQYNGNDWIYRTNAIDQVAQGDTLSVWLQFAGNADGRAYFGFGASSLGTLSLVAAPNTDQLIIQSNLGWGFTNLAAVNQTFQPNQWYRLEVDWGTSGAIVGKLYASDGATLLNQVTATTTAITSGGIAFRATGSDKYWDTVTVSYNVNNFTQQAAKAAATADYDDGLFGTTNGKKRRG
jgi:hypothetical protein